MNQPRESQDARDRHDLAEVVIDRLYDVAMDPLRYEELLDHWESMIAPYRASAGSDREVEPGLGAFAPHFTRADRVLDKLLEHPGDEAAHARHLADYARVAAFVVDGSLRVTEVNPAGQTALGLAAGGDLSALPIDPADIAHFQDECRRLLRANHETERLILRAHLSGRDRLALFHLRRVSDGRGRPLVLAVSSEIGWPPEFAALLTNAFELTRTEIEILRLLTECRSLRDIADLRKRSVETIRAQLRAIMAKTETRTQQELLRLTLTTMEMADFTADTAGQLLPESKGFGTLEPRRFHSVTLPDGRLMEYLILGATKGRSIVFLPLDYGLCRWPASAEAEAERRGIRVIVPLRQGYGKSTPVPGGLALGPTVADDIDHLMGKLGLSACPVVTLAGDTFYASHLFARHDSRMSALIACAGVLPLSGPEQYERMDKWHRFILAGARYTPHLLPFMVKAGFALARRIGKRGFVHAVYGKSAADVATFEDPEVYEAMVCGSEVALSETHSAHDAFSREVIEQETTDWSGLIDAMEGRIPVHFLNGLDDPQVPPDTLAEHKARYPWIDFIEYRDAGQLLFFRHWRDVLHLAERYL